MLKPPPDSDRCTHETADGRRCRALKMAADSPLCSQHFRAEEKRRLRSQQIVRRSADAALRLAPAASFANALPAAAEQFVAEASDSMPGSVISINQLIERVLHLLVANQMTARSATAAAQLLRLMLKAQPQVEAETVTFNQMLRLQQSAASPLSARSETVEASPASQHDEGPPSSGASPASDNPEHVEEPLTDDALTQLFEPTIAQHLIRVRRAQAARHVRATASLDATSPAHAPAAL